VFENVRGLLTIDDGEGFRTLVQDLADIGAVFVEWAMLDSQHFGLPQRRQRVFTVACFDPRTAEHCPSPLLPVAEKRKGDSRKVTATGQGSTGTVEKRPRKRGFQADRGIVGALTAFEGWERPDNAHAEAGRLIPVNLPHLDILGSITTAFNSKNYSNLQEVGAGSIVPVYTPTVYTPTGFANWIEQVGTLRARDYKGDANIVVETIYTKSKRAQTSQDDETWVEGEISPTLNCFDNVGEGHSTILNVEQAIGFNWANGGGYGNAHDGLGITPNGTGPLTTSQVPAVATANQVRRITPLECERLQGWPDNHTLLDANGKTQSDTTRYKQIGNGISAPVAQWIAEQINNAENHTPQQ